jgi:phenylalanyl-tRNA synthetase beta chain
MLCSINWLRALAPVDADAEELAETLTARGLTVDALERRGEDVVLDIDVPANRPDGLGHLGLAREIAAAYGARLSPSAVPEPSFDRAPDPEPRVEIDEPTLCRRFTASLVRDVRVGPSPGWVAQRLEACGLRPINNVVDASNLVLLETGNPIHFYDLELVRDALLRVRRAVPGELLVTLDGVKRTLDAEMLVIADGERAVGLAGVMGGADTEIRETTREVLIEAAWFEPTSVRGTARRLALTSDASHRFERGVDPEGVLLAQALARKLLTDLAGGRPVPGLVDVYPGAAEPPGLSLRLDQLPRLLGYRPEDDEVLRALDGLRLSPEGPRDGAIEVTVPSWRVDLEREVDLVEEVARVLGYDRIPTHVEGLPVVSTTDRDADLGERARDLLAQLGFHEAIGYAMIGHEEDAPFVPAGVSGGVALSNPIADSLADLRRSILPGLLRATDLNQRRGVRDIRLFEVGKAFLSRDGETFPDEPLRVGLAWSGAGTPRHWSAEVRDADLFDMVGVVEHLLGALRPEARAERRQAVLPGLHPGLSLSWVDPEERTLAWAGALHPELQAGLAHPVLLAEIDLDAVGRFASGVARYSAVPRLTPVQRDLSLVLTGGTSFADIERVLRAVDPPAPIELHAIDRYEGAPLADGEVSLTVRVVLRPDERTLTEAEIEGFRGRLVEALERKLGVRIRG